MQVLREPARPGKQSQRQSATQQSTDRKRRTAGQAICRPHNTRHARQARHLMHKRTSCTSAPHAQAHLVHKRTCRLSIRSYERWPLKMVSPSRTCSSRTEGEDQLADLQCKQHSTQPTQSLCGKATSGASACKPSRTWRLRPRRSRRPTFSAACCTKENGNVHPG